MGFVPFLIQLNIFLFFFILLHHLFGSFYYIIMKQHTKLIILYIKIYTNLLSGVGSFTHPPLNLSYIKPSELDLDLRGPNPYQDTIMGLTLIGLSSSCRHILDHTNYMNSNSSPPDKLQLLDLSDSNSKIVQLQLKNQCPDNYTVHQRPESY
jgi:hypothetical protein